MLICLFLNWTHKLKHGPVFDENSGTDYEEGVKPILQHVSGHLPLNQSEAAEAAPKPSSSRAGAENSLTWNNESSELFLHDKHTKITHD